MIIRSRAPLRLGLAGGGTDVSPYSDIYGGAILNVTISMYTYCTIEVTNDNKIEFFATDLNKIFSCESCPTLPIDGVLDLHKGVYNRIVKDFNNGKPLSFKMTTYSEAPAGSGLGTSSTMVVAILKAYVEWLKLPLGEYDIAKLAYEIEREDLQLSGGKQDQYAATFGGFNFMQFNRDSVIVNPLRVKRWIINELECSLVLYFTGVSRSSAKIINDQIDNAKKGETKSIAAMDELKEQAYLMKNYLLVGNINGICDVLKESWESKKKVSQSITNNFINECYDFIMENGGKAAKVSGAGGGGFMMIICDPKDRCNLVEKLKEKGGNTYTITFELDGTRGWTID